MAQPPSPYTVAQQAALAAIPKVSGTASGLLSLVIVATVARDPRRRRRTYHRLVGGLSLVDCSSSLWLSLSTWPIPRGSGALWASGTGATCRLQGFFTQFGIASILYNASLSLYFVLVICYGWRDHQVRRVEPYLHAAPLLWALGTSVAGLGLDAFGSANLWCWVRPSSQAFRWAAFYCPLWLMILVITGTCLFIYSHVKRIEAATDRRRARLLAGYGSAEGGASAEGRLQDEGGTAADPESSEALSSGRSRPAPPSSEARATAGEDARDYQDDDLDPEAFRAGGAGREDPDGDADNDGDDEEDDDDDGTASGERCVASSVFEDVVLSRTNQTLETEAGAAAGEPHREPSRDGATGEVETGPGEGSSQAARRSFLDRKACLFKGRFGGQRRLARDELRLRRTRQVARQSFLYAGAFYLNWTALSVRVHPRPRRRLRRAGLAAAAGRLSTFFCRVASHADHEAPADRSREDVLPAAGDRRPYGPHPGAAQLLGVPGAQCWSEPASAAPTLPPSRGPRPLVVPKPAERGEAPGRCRARRRRVTPRRPPSIPTTACARVSWLNAFGHPARLRTFAASALSPFSAEPPERVPGRPFIAPYLTQRALDLRPPTTATALQLSQVVAVYQRGSGSTQQYVTVSVRQNCENDEPTRNVLHATYALYSHFFKKCEGNKHFGSYI
jgi:hypothetical protein